jgi:hypothetical protein
MNTSRLSMSELVAEHNRLAAIVGVAPTKRFSDRATGEKRVAALAARVPAPAPAAAPRKLRAELAARATGPAHVDALRVAEYVRGTCPSCGATADITCGRVITRAGRQEEVDTDRAHCHSCGHEFSYETGRAMKARAASPERAARIAASWSDPEVRADRLVRVGCRVTVPGTAESRVFPSVAKAFIALNLPMSRHIRVRMDMKHAGSVEFMGRVFERVERAS